MQDIVICEESLSAHEPVKPRMTLTRIQLNPLPFRCGVQRLVKLYFPNGSEVNQFVPNDARALRFEVCAAAPLLPGGSSGINI